MKAKSSCKNMHTLQEKQAQQNMQSCLCFLLAKGHESSREPRLFIPQTKGGITFSWCLLRKPLSSSGSVSHYRWLWMTGNCMWHLNRVRETPPFCLSNSAAVVSPLPAADTILHSFQHSVGRVLLKTCSCWLSACAAGSLGLAACVLWCAEQPDTFQMNPSMCQSLRCPRAWFPVG